MASPVPKLWSEMASPIPKLWTKIASPVTPFHSIVLESVRPFYSKLLRANSSFLAFSQKLLIFQRNGLCIQDLFNITENISKVFVTWDNPFNGM